MNIAASVASLWRSARARAASGAVVLALGAALGGCQSNADLLEANRTLQERNDALVAENKRLKDELARLGADMSSLRESNGQLASLNEKLRAENENLRRMLRQYGEDLEGLKFQALDPTTDEALRALADQYPDLLEYDAARGMIRFKSDMTFASGSDEVNASAKPSIDALARILQSDAAMGYDVRIVGHTDSQRISGRTAPKHPTNWHLSTHRAIAVGRELINQSVKPTRVEAAGRGEFDPMVPNTPSGNTPRNRRVEVFLARGSNRSATNIPAGRDEPIPAPNTPRREEIMK